MVLVLAVFFTFIWIFCVWPISYEFDQKQKCQGNIWMVVAFWFALKRSPSICNVQNASFSFSEEHFIPQKKKPTFIVSLHGIKQTINLL